MAGSLQELLSQAAEALRVPVLVLTLVLALVTVYQLGRFAIEMIRRARPARGRTTRLLLTAARERSLPREALAAMPSRSVADAARRLFTEPSTSAAHEQTLAAFELTMQKRLEPGRALVRAGPALGLMGTLIPLAPGLGALGRGDISTLATDLRTAFAATILGLAAGMIGFVITLVRTRLYAEDLNLLERTANALRESAPAGSGAPAVPDPDRGAAPPPPPADARAPTPEPSR